MIWRNVHKDPPQIEQRVYYFGPNIGLWVGTYNYEPRSIFIHGGNPIELCPHTFSCDDGFGYCDGDDAPYWMEYDAHRESEGWRPIVPKEYTKDLYLDEDE